MKIAFSLHRRLQMGQLAMEWPEPALHLMPISFLSSACAQIEHGDASSTELREAEMRYLGCGCRLAGVIIVRAGLRHFALHFVEDALRLLVADVKGAPQVLHRVVLAFMHQDASEIGDYVSVMVIRDAADQKWCTFALAFENVGSHILLCGCFRWLGRDPFPHFAHLHRQMALTIQA